MNFNNDIINSLFEFAAAGFVLNHLRVLFKHKQVKGVSALSTTFFCAYSAFSVYFFGKLNQPFSYFGSVILLIVNLIYTFFILFYK